jgi:RNA polymerase sigma factor (sigma-70 family)
VEAVLSREEERDLARLMEAGVLARELRLGGSEVSHAEAADLLLIEEEGDRARLRFMSANLPLVSLVVRELAPRRMFREPDLFQEGCVGLAVAVLRFDYTRDIRFATYALYWIRAYVGAATARQLGAMNLPISRAEQYRMARRCEAELTQALGRLPTTGELARALGKDEGWTSQLISYQRPQSLNALDPDLVTDSTEQLAGVNSFQREALGAELLRRLDDLDRQLLEYRLGFTDGEPHTYAETARALQMSATHVRRREHRALEQLRRICPQSASEHL